MSALRYTLIADGPSDRCLVWVIDWCLAAIPKVAASGFLPQVADLRTLPSPPKTLRERIAGAIRQYPCDFLLIHRDAEDEPAELRRTEIHAAATEIAIPRVPIIPVRMTEAWLLLEEAAIRKAADNPNGRISLELPDVPHLERILDPKALLSNLLVRAAEKTGRRRDQFVRDLAIRRQRVAELIGDFSPLRQISAFQSFERELRTVVLARLEDGA